MNLDLSFLNAKLVLPVDYKTIEFWLVGAGGTGSFMAMNLARLAFELKTLGKQTKIVIVDPDSVETSNIPRSNFCFAESGLNKAETLANRASRAWGIEIGFVKEGFRPELLQSKNDDWTFQTSNSNKLTILVGCVDNHLARHEIHEALKFYGERSYDNSSPRVWWIDGGNGRDTGQVLIGNRLNEKEICESARKSPILSLLPAPSLQHPDLLRKGERKVRSSSNGHPQTNDAVTCAERIRLGEQSLNVNQRVAVEINEMLTALLLTNSLKRFATYFDLESGTSRSLYTTQEKIEQAVNLAAIMTVMFQNNESASQKENEVEKSSAGILTPNEIYRKLILALECKEPHPPAGWCASQLDEEIRRAGREFEPDARLRQADALQTCLFYLVDFARRMPEWINTTPGNERVKLLCRELAEEIEKITLRPAEAIERGGKLKVWLKAILAVQTCLIYREETTRNIKQQDEAKSAATFSPVKNKPVDDASFNEEERYSALAKNIFENVCGKSFVKPSDKSRETQPSLF